MNPGGPLWLVWSVAPGMDYLRKDFHLDVSFDSLLGFVSVRRYLQKQLLFAVKTQRRVKTVFLVLDFSKKEALVVEIFLLLTDDNSFKP